MTDARSKYASAREWLASSERRAMIDKEKERMDARALRSRNWLEQYLARPRFTGFIWVGKLKVTYKNQDGANNESTEAKQEG